LSISMNYGDSLFFSASISFNNSLADREDLVVLTSPASPATKSTRVASLPHQVQQKPHQNIGLGFGREKA
jgi:hypothetical protein